MAPGRPSADSSLKIPDPTGFPDEFDAAREPAAPSTSSASTAAAVPTRLRIARSVDKYLWVWLFALTALDFGAIWHFLPHVREDVTLPQFVLKVSAFVLAVIAVSTFPQKWDKAFLLLSLPSLVFLGFIIPKMMWLFLQGPQTEPEYYTYLWSLNYPGILLSIAFAYRIGGGSSGRVLKIGLNGVILVFSGYLELMWFVVNPWNYYDLPSIPHVQVILGFFPSYAQLFVFALCHIPLVALVIWAPFDRWLEQWRARIYRDTTAPVAPVRSSTSLAEET